MTDTALILWTHVVIMITALIGLVASFFGIWVSRLNSKAISRVEITVNGDRRRMTERLVELEARLAVDESRKGE